MAEHEQEYEKDTLTVSEEASALAADRNRRISFNDAAIAVTHEYPSEECWGDRGETEAEAEAETEIENDSGNRDTESDSAEPEEEDREKNDADADEDEDEPDVTNSRLYALFALKAQQEKPACTGKTRPAYDELVDHNSPKAPRNHTMPTAIRLIDDGGKELNSFVSESTPKVTTTGPADLL